MTDDVRQAAERLREHRRVCAAMEHPRSSPYTFIEVSTGAAGFVPEAETKDMATVVTAYLDEHGEDDGEPVTLAWLKSVGFVTYGVLADYQGGLALRDLEYQDGRVWRWMDRTLPKQPKTRGEVRRLRAALGLA